jgi:hypothetical protein
MKYNPRTYELRTDAGKWLKKLNCPLYKQWSQLYVVSADDSQRHCGSCDRLVINLSGKTDAEAEALLQASPDCCVYIGGTTRNIRYDHDHAPKDDPCPFRRIRTARA